MAGISSGGSNRLVDSGCNHLKGGGSMKEIVKEAIKNEMAEDWNMVQIQNDYVTDLMLEYPELIMPEARTIFKGALCRNFVASAIRVACRNFMETGRYDRKEH